MKGNPEAENLKQSPVFYGVLIYTAIFFLQVGSRISAFGAIRIEFVVGIAILLNCVPEFFKQDHEKEEKQIITPLFWFFIAIFLSIPTTIAGFNTIDMLISFAKSFSIFFMIMVGLNSEKDLKKYMYVFVIMVGFIIVEAFIVRPMHNSSGLMRLNAVTRLFAHPNALGGLGAALLPILYYLFWYEKKIFVRGGLALLGVITFIVVSMTQSRSAIIGIAGGVIYIWCMSKKKVIAIVMMFVLCFMAWISLDDITKERYLSMGDASAVVSGQKSIQKENGETVSRSSMSARYEIILDGFRLFAMRPVNGFGIGGFQTARIERLGRWQVCHNAYVQCLSELGMIGFISWAFILYRTFFLLGKIRHTIELNTCIEQVRFIYFLTKAIQANLMVHFALSIFGHTPYDYYWWIPVALTIKMSQIVKSNSYL